MFVFCVCGGGESGDIEGETLCGEGAVTVWGQRLSALTCWHGETTLVFREGTFRTDVCAASSTSQDML
jgi:hypothetical protein